MPTSSVLLQGGGKQSTMYDTHAGCQVGNRGESTGRVDQSNYERNKAVRNEGVGREGAKPKENGRTGYKKHTANVGNGKAVDSKQGSPGRPGYNVQLTLKSVASKKPTPKALNVKSGGHVRVHAERTKKTHSNTCLVRGIGFPPISPYFCIYIRLIRVG